ncbi:TIGR00341 family protein [Clostridium beijerinckii]|uniref:TIGR00341 family protein n=1 Tax=Clostridium beijerinckii TaxID=1520 RepID=UPI001361D5D8|nr:TIGR00341 family protein [Clostridium beijerinckii]MZK52119.1 TIGR00341 family protein [Clostridium beijerinckii]MZK61260.1 TIGR00341 family protein [Clostridium beijerinckii]MZK71503.1 TIGR00341 family protein [Clostridium beijerinckii]MZK76862.1 TIGR00341 family protein [Clostridium beijerinckii]MZK85512.1 TIGR00341 family protein [Clostridium beijerinckii]
MFSFLPIISPEKRKLVYDSIKMESSIGVTYFLLVILAAVVATLGLLTNSTAVIIGAMLISPIMSPIIGMSFSMTLGDSKMFSRSIKGIILGTVVAITVSVFITLFIPSRSLTPEILSRTKPTIIDLVIALASGAAGAYTMCHKKESSVIPGVAIATALMPPLCVVGTGLVQNEYAVAFGGFLLFLTNLIAINLASALVFKLSGFTTKDEIDKSEKHQTILKMNQRRLLISITVFAIITIPLSYIMYTTIAQERTKKLISDSLAKTTSTFDGVDLVNYTYELKDNKVLINTVVRSIGKLNGDNIKLMENSLEKQIGKPTAIKMKVILAQEVDTSTKPIDTTTTEETDPKTQASTVESPPILNADKTIEYAIKDKLTLSKAQLVDFSFSYSSNSAQYIIDVTAEGNEKLSKDIETSIESVLEHELNRKIVVNIKFTLLKEPISDTSLPTPVENLPEADIYKP